MRGNRIFSHGVVVAREAHRFGVTYVIYSLYTLTGLTNTKAAPIQNLLIRAGMQVGEPLAELELLAIDHYATIAAHMTFRQVGPVYA